MSEISGSSWWQTLPGVLTAVGAVLTAVTGWTARLRKLHTVDRTRGRVLTARPIKAPWSKRSVVMRGCRPRTLPLMTYFTK
jgi:hypothetical protein